MKDHYNQKIIGIQQGRLVYSVPNHGQIDRIFNEVAFYDYKLITENFTESGMQVTLNVEEAARYVDNNNIRILKHQDFGNR